MSTKDNEPHGPISDADGVIAVTVAVNSRASSVMPDRRTENEP